MSVDEILNKFKRCKWALPMSAKALSKRWHCPVEDIRKARDLYHNVKLPKILIFDIETAPMTAYVWRRWKQNISLDQTISEWFIICWSAKWLYEDKVMGDVLTSEEAIQQNDKRITESLWKLIDEADIVVAYNGKKADIPWMNTRFICNGLVPPSPYRIIDPIETAKRRFAFSSNKLDALAGYFNIPHKLETTFELWKGCMQGDKESLNYMLEYNKKDSYILEEVYLKLRPWIQNHPNIANLTDENCCPHCGSFNYETIEDKYYNTQTGKYVIHRCKHCGTIFRDRKKCNESTMITTIPGK